MSFSSDYQILVKQMFHCKGVANYNCPVGVFDESGYTIVNSTALCPSCFAVYTQKTTKKGDRVQTKQRIIHFLHSMQWTVGNGGYMLSFKHFWGEFYRWSEEQHLYTKKSLVRSVLTEMCGVAYDASHIPITPSVLTEGLAYDAYHVPITP